MSDLSKLWTIRRLAEELAPQGITYHSIRWAVFNEHNNGLAEFGAVIRPPHTRRVYIDRERYEAWLRSGVERRRA